MRLDLGVGGLFWRRHMALGMSEVDKEAEREKLRQKFEAEEREREETRRMSDLLLRGATMTNKHCGECGNPVFRHEGRLFCPTCQQPVGKTDTVKEEQQVADTEDETAAAQAPEALKEEVEQPARDAPAQEAGETAPTPPVRAGQTQAGSVGEARASLVRSLVRYARAAEQAENVHRAREYLAAATEAADALAALNAIE